MNLFSSQYTNNSIKLIKIYNIKSKYKNNLNIIKINLKMQEEIININTQLMKPTFGT